MITPERRKMLDDHLEKYGFIICPKCNYDHVDKKVICCKNCGIYNWQIQYEKRDKDKQENLK